MVNPDVIFGRLGNRMFQGAFLYAQSRELKTDFYFQNQKYFQKYEQEIKTLFGDGIGYLDQVGIHVRRGKNPINLSEPEYSKNPFYVNLCGTDYYERAMQLFPEETFVIFSDNPEYCKEHFVGPNIQVMEMGDEVEDFNLLASCKHQIIANSSFSWWAAYLNPNPSKVIVAPREWYADGSRLRTVVPSEWIVI